MLRFVVWTVLVDLILVLLLLTGVALWAILSDQPRHCPYCDHICSDAAEYHRHAGMCPMRAM